MTLTIDLPGLLPSGLNTMLRQHWRARGKERDAVLVHVLSALSMLDCPELPMRGPLRVVFTRRSIKLLDIENGVSSFKHIGDALVKCGVLEDDNPEILAELLFKQERVPHKKDQGVIVTLEPLH